MGSLSAMISRMAACFAGSLPNGSTKLSSVARSLTIYPLSPTPGSLLMLEPVLVDDRGYGVAATLWRAAYHASHTIHHYIFVGPNDSCGHQDRELDGRSDGHFFLQIKQNAPRRDVFRFSS